MSRILIFDINFLKTVNNFKMEERRGLIVIERIYFIVIFVTNSIVEYSKSELFKQFSTVNLLKRRKFLPRLKRARNIAE